MLRHRLASHLRTAASVVLLVAAMSPTLAWAQDVKTSTPSSGECTRTDGTPAPYAGPALDAPITLSPAKDQEQALVNFDTGRSTKAATFVFKSDRALPVSVKPENLELLADPILRSGAGLETTDFPPPTFSQPVIQKNRTRITVAVCLNPAGVDPGKYTTHITLGGPEGVNSATVGLTANLKAGWGFALTLLAALVLAFAALGAKEAVRAIGTRPRWDGKWWVTTVGSLAVAAAAMMAVWTSDPAWGAGFWAPAAALVGTALSGVGIQSLANVTTD